MEFGLAPFILDKFRTVFERYPLVQQAVIYGSRARGDYKSSSDIDLAVYAPEMNREQFGLLRFELDELPIVFTMDIVHMESLQNLALKEKIEREGKQVFP